MKRLMTTVRTTVYFPSEPEEFRDVSLEVIPSNKELRGGSGFAVDRPAPSYRLAGYNLEPLNMPSRPDVKLMATKAPAF